MVVGSLITPDPTFPPLVLPPGATCRTAPGVSERAEVRRPVGQRHAVGRLSHGGLSIGRKALQHISEWVAEGTYTAASKHARFCGGTTQRQTLEHKDQRDSTMAVALLMVKGERVDCAQRSQVLLLLRPRNGEGTLWVPFGKAGDSMPTSVTAEEIPTSSHTRVSDLLH